MICEPLRRARRALEAGGIEVLYSDHENRLILVVDDEERGRRISEEWARGRERTSAVRQFLAVRFRDGPLIRLKNSTWRSVHLLHEGAWMFVREVLEGADRLSR